MMIGVIAGNTFREAIRERIWVVMVLFGIALLLGNRILTPIALGEGPRATVDLGLATLSFLGLLVTIVVGGSLVHQEIDRRTVHVILARPVSRTVYLIGKWLGLTAMLWATGLILGGALVGVAWHVRGAAVVLPLVQAVVMLCCSFAMLSALAVLFSALSTPLLASLYTLGSYVLGWWATDLRLVAGHLPEPVRTILAWASYALPNLEVLSARFAVAHAEPVPWLQVALAIVYAGCYAASVLALATIAFRAREFR